jgi:enoyl-CoA hydratase/carnithine racemase
MPAEQYFVEPERLWVGAGPWEAPLAVIDLDADRPWPDTVMLPPCPVIGIGARDHPRAGLLDSVIEPPVSLDAVVRKVERNAQAAEVLIGLMRMHAGEGLRLAAAFEAESLAYAVLQGGTAHRHWIAAREADQRMLSPGNVRLEREEDYLRITLDRPAAGNAIDRAMRDALHDAFTLAALDPGIVRIELAAEGRTFSLGADLDEFGTTLDPVEAHAIRTRTLPARALTRFKGLIYVRVQGACVGSGLELAAFGTWISATRDAWFQLPELAMGIIPGAGGCVSLPRRIGRQRTALMVLSGRRIGAATALDWGLADAIVDDPA